MTARYMDIAGELRDAIVRGEYAVGAQLPSEAELAVRFSASRGTVRQAVAVLATEGWSGPGRGPDVSCSAASAARASPS